MSASTLLGPEIALNRAEEVIETFPARHRWTMSEFQRMAETGFLDPDARLELLEGELFEMAPIGYFHAGMTRILAEKFRMAVGRAAIVDCQNPIALDDYSQPQPDLALLRPRSDYYLNGHPRADDVLLLVEVSDSTVQFDRKTKLPLYLQHRIPEVWLVVGPLKRHIEVYRYPQPDYGGYQTCLHFHEGALAPLLLPDAEIQLAELFL
jgi:Uma2 family endonuclease